MKYNSCFIYGKHGDIVSDSVTMLVIWSYINLPALFVFWRIQALLITSPSLTYYSHLLFQSIRHFDPSF